MSAIVASTLVDENTNNNTTTSATMNNDLDIDRPHKKLCAQLDSQHYIRIDEEIIERNSSHLHTNAIHGTLNGHQMISRYEIYQKVDVVEVAAIVHIGENLCGHPGIVHGGIISALFDNTFGWLFFTMKQPPAFTANLNVNFRKPIMANTTAILRASIKEIQVTKSFEIDNIFYQN